MLDSNLDRGVSDHSNTGSGLCVNVECLWFDSMWRESKDDVNKISLNIRNKYIIRRSNDV